MFKRALILAAALVYAGAAGAQSAMTRSALINDANTYITSNSVGAITGPILNLRLRNQDASMATLLDANTLSALQTFSGGFATPGLTGFLVGNGSGAVTATTNPILSGTVLTTNNAGTNTFTSSDAYVQHFISSSTETNIEFTNTSSGGKTYSLVSGGSGGLFSGGSFGVLDWDAGAVRLSINNSGQVTIPNLNGYVSCNGSSPCTASANIPLSAVEGSSGYVSCNGGSSPSAYERSCAKIGSFELFPSIGIAPEKLAEETPGIARSLSRIPSSLANFENHLFLKICTLVFLTGENASSNLIYRTELDFKKSMNELILV